MESSPSSTDKLNFRAKVLTGHLNQQTNHPPILQCSPSPCLSYTPPEISEPAAAAAVDVFEMRKLMDGHNLQDRDWLYGIMIQSPLFNPREKGGKVFVAADYNQSMEQQREMTMRRIWHLLDCGVYKGWLTENGPEAELRKLALLDVIALFDHSLSVKLGVHFILWGGAIQFLGTKRHHDEWLRDTENYAVKGCFAMTELGHGSNVRGIETVTTYDSSTGEFVINTPCESAQKYWIGGAANHATHTIVFSQLKIDGEDQGVHAFIAQIRDANGNICPNIRIADCGHKIGLNGVDNGRIWFDNVRVPRENLLNSVADVSPDGKYLTAIKDPDRLLGVGRRPEGPSPALVDWEIIEQRPEGPSPTPCLSKCGVSCYAIEAGKYWEELLGRGLKGPSPTPSFRNVVLAAMQRFGVFMAPLTTGRVTIPSIVTYSAKVGIAIAIRYSLTRRAFSVTPNGPEVLLLDYPSHQRRLLPLLAKTYAMSFAANFLKKMYVNRRPEMIKTLHVVSSAFKATLSWHNMRTLQECREACGGQGLKTENRIGQAKSEYDVHSTFEGDNNILMQQVSKALLAEYVTCKRKGKPFKGLGLEHMNESLSNCPVIPSKLDSEALRSIQFQNDIFCLRERHLLNHFAAEVSQHQARGEGKENAFLLSYQLAEDLGRAFADRTIYHTFVNAEASVNSGSLKNILGLVRSMYAMVNLDEEAAYLRYGCLTTDNAAAVRKEIATLCSELRPHALALVTSFGIPDAFLSPIAFNWVDSNAWSSL